MKRSAGIQFTLLPEELQSILRLIDFKLSFLRRMHGMPDQKTLWEAVEIEKLRQVIQKRLDIHYRETC